MLKNFFLKLFCCHKWNTHAKEVYEHEETEVVASTEHWIKPLTQTQTYSETVEVLICECCGKITKITY